jgi:NAD(P)-dependent dehydrogenase (short-subunit alcohol dehydrogenase family)
MAGQLRTAIVTGASQGIGAGLVSAFLERGYRVVATSRNMSQSGAFREAGKLALVDGDIADPVTAAKIAETAVARFGTIDVLVNNAGIYFSKPFIDYTLEDFRSLASTNLEGFLHVTQRAVKQMLLQKSGGSVVTISATLAGSPNVATPSSVPMITKGGLEAITRSLAIEFARVGIRFNAVAPGPVETPMHENEPKDFMKTLSPMGRISTIRDIVDAVLYLTEAANITGEILRVDGGSHVGKW